MKNPKQPQDETEYLLSNPKNKKRLLEAVKQVDEGKVISFTEEEFENFTAWIESLPIGTKAPSADEMRKMLKDGFFRETPNAETIVAMEEARAQITSGEKGTTDIDVFFRELDSQCENSL